MRLWFRSWCGEGGKVICCDKCIRSFHVECLPGVATADDLPPPWFCPVCQQQLQPVGAAA